MRPSFSAELEVDISEASAVMGDIKLIQTNLYEVCSASMRQVEQQAIVERINRERADIRWYLFPDGSQVPSVTSIIGFADDFGMPPEELQQYASQSNLAHLQVARFIETGKWVEPAEIDDAWADLVIVSKGSLKLPTGGWSFPGFLEKYPVKEMKNGVASINLEHRYGGTPDFIGIPDFEGAEKVLTLFDVKRTPDKLKNFKQLAAYANMKGNEEVKQIVIVPLNDKTNQGFSKPIVESKIDGYFKVFLRDRSDFHKRYGA